MICYNCGFDVVTERKIFRQDTCPECDSYLRCCLNCTFYDPVAYHECREPQARWTRDKESANFCDYFEPSKDAFNRKNKAKDAKSNLNDLFKKPED